MYVWCIYFASVSTIYRLDFGTGFMLYLLSSNRIVLKYVPQMEKERNPLRSTLVYPRF